MADKSGLFNTKAVRRTNQSESSSASQRYDNCPPVGLPVILCILHGQIADTDLLFGQARSQDFLHGGAQGFDRGAQYFVIGAFR
jgi:hypothetical protein